MFDLLKASDLGVTHHLTLIESDVDSTEFYTSSVQDILNKITHLSCDLDERDFELARTKPLFPVGFKIKPENNFTNTQSSHHKPFSQVQAQSYSQARPNYLQKSQTPVVAPSETDYAEFVSQKIALAEQIAQEAQNLSDLLAKIQDFQSGLDSQKFSAKTLVYDDAQNIDILWINDSVSFDDDKNHRIMSDVSGKMIVDLFDTLGYGRMHPKDYGQIGYTALSFWAINDNTMKKDSASAEYQICLPFIKRLISLLNPKKIILSGDMALKFIMQTDNCDSLGRHGEKIVLSVDNKHFDCFICFGRSYILRSEAIKKLFWFDLLKILHDNT